MFSWRISLATARSRLVVLSDLVPGGAHTYSKARYPPNAPDEIVRSKGGTVWDGLGRSFVDWSGGISQVLIGHCEPSIDDAAIAAIRNGQAFGRPSRLEYEAAETVLDFWKKPVSDWMIKFSKTGSSVNDAGIRLARAVTGRQHIAFDGTAPFFSTSDWFCAHQMKHAGTLDAEVAFSHKYYFNDVASVERVFERYPLACLILEVCRTIRPKPEFLQAVARLCREHGTLLLVDEVVTGYRFGYPGAHSMFGLEPDLIAIGKGMSNGYSCAALLGRREYMRRGAIEGDVFLLSTTNGAEQSGLAAAIATAEFYREHDVQLWLHRQGRELMQIVDDAAGQHGLSFAAESDFACRPAFPDAPESFFATLIDHGVLLPPFWCCPCYRRTHEEMEQTRAAVFAACARLESEQREVARGLS